MPFTWRKRKPLGSAASENHSTRSLAVLVVVGCVRQPTRVNTDKGIANPAATRIGRYHVRSPPEQQGDLMIAHKLFYGVCVAALCAASVSAQSSNSRTRPYASPK